MTPRPQERTYDEVQAMLARATQSQLQRLLHDIGAKPEQGTVKYDA